MTHADIKDLETRDYIFKIGDRGKGIQARYDENTDTLIFPRAAFDYVYKSLKEPLSQELTDVISREDAIAEINDTIAGYIPFFDGRTAKIPLELNKAIMRVPTVTQNGTKNS